MMEHDDQRGGLRRLRPGFAALCATVLATACAGTSGDVAAVQAEGDWIQASPMLRQQIDDEAERLPWTHGFERLEQIRWFASVGEPAYPKLLALAIDPRDDVAAAALAALGATMDRRLVPRIRGLAWSAERLQGDLGLERARTLVRLGDWSQMPFLIRGLSDGRVYTRALCAEALREATGETFDFDPRAPDEARAKSVAAWEAWWLARSGEGILSAS
jgi:hypothetical protein